MDMLYMRLLFPVKGIHDAFIKDVVVILTEIHEETGLTGVNSLLKTKIKLSETLLNLEKQLGFTPITRNSVIVPDKEEMDTSAFLELVNG